MQKKSIKFQSSITEYYSSFNFRELKELTDRASSILITDENIYNAHTNKFRGWNTIILKAGEEFKIQGTVDSVIEQLIEFAADRSSTLIGVGGGVITDITGYVASIYMRGIKFGFIPTSILGLVDASIGGKNGIDVGDHKNMVGVIRQPAFILHDLDFLGSLPQKEWENGFAEIIKHGCIADSSMFRELEKKDISEYKKNRELLQKLIRRNFLLKTAVVQKDEFEKGERRLLNFGHTLGHALETQYELLHGEAIALGMIAACHISESITGFPDTARVSTLLEKYHLPVSAAFDADKVFNVLKMDKKRVRNEISYVLLEKIGKAVIRPLSLKKVEKYIRSLS